MNTGHNNVDHNAVAIVGMAGRFPGAPTLEAFWHNLRDGVESVCRFSAAALRAAGVPAELVARSDYVGVAAKLDGVEEFDADFFGFSPREAELADPQLRLFLECAWESIESAGYAPETYDGVIGVYAGSHRNTYLDSNLDSHPELFETHGGQILLGNGHDFLATTVSYKLNLTGPSVNVRTACSTSLVAVYLAVQGLLNYDCDMALAGAVSITVPQTSGYRYRPGGVMSRDGHCRAFDADATGSVPGSGAGAVLLKRLTDAIAARDPIRAVIRGVAINNDGSRKVGYAAPSVKGQAEVIALAQATSATCPDTISYVETHGTGTPMGDPVEIAALTKAFGATMRTTGPCAIGSVKTNIGHLDAAAGVAGLIKTVLMLEQKVIPPSLHFVRPNPQINFASSPFYVNTSPQPWQPTETPRRAAISAFGIGGTNAHAILEEAPQAQTDASDRTHQLLVLSARNEVGLGAAADRLASHLEAHPTQLLADVAYTLQVGRRPFRHRAALVCRSVDDALKALRDRDRPRLLTATQIADPSAAFIFPGLGDHYTGMARQLYVEEPIFREHVDICCDILQPLGTDLRKALFPAHAVDCKEEYVASPRVGGDGPDLRSMLAQVPPESSLDRTALAHPALFVIEYSLAKLWMHLGVKPQAMLGYSLGEYVAACLSGVLTLNDALLLVARRAELVDSLPGGSMMAVPLPESEIEPFLGSNLAIAAINGPSVCVLTGPSEDVSSAERELAERGLACRRIHSSHAFHSPLMKPVAASLAELTGRFRLRPPSIPYVSNVTGTWIKAEEATDPAYWGTHLCRTVRFSEGVRQICDVPGRVLLEVGPGHGLCSLALQQLQAQGQTDVTAVSCLRHDWERHTDRAVWLRAVGQLWLEGLDIDWAKIHDGKRRRVVLPTYPFERQRYWIEPCGDSPHHTASRIFEKATDISDWFYVPAWRRAVSSTSDTGQPASRSWIIFAEPGTVADEIAERLLRNGDRVVKVFSGPVFRRYKGAFYIRPDEPEDYHRLLENLANEGEVPSRIVHAWSASNDPCNADRNASSDRFDTDFKHLLVLTQALSRHRITQPLDLNIMTAGAQDVSGDEPLHAERWLIQGLSKVIPQEHQNISCRTIDIPLNMTTPNDQFRLIDLVIEEMRTPARGAVVAVRGDQRWVQTFAHPRFHPKSSQAPLREGGVYLITGGFGKIGSVLADYLARTLGAKLVLVGRASTESRQRQITALENAGAEVLSIAADISDQDQVQRAVAEMRCRFGAVHGVIHAAGVTDTASFLTIAEMDRASCGPHFRAKVQGLDVLARACRGLELDFFALFSSSSAFLGGIGLGAYAAANSFMNGFAQKQMRSSPYPWISMNWDTWQIGGINISSPDSRAAGATVSNLVMNADEGIDAFRRALASGTVGPVVISPGDLEARARMWVELADLGTGSRAAQSVPRHPRPRIPTPYIAPRTSTEQILAESWQDALGIDAIGIHDNFYDLGGHSLLATRLVAKLRQTFNIELTLRSILERPTIAELVDVIIERQAAGLDAGTLSQVLCDLRKEPEGQVKALLAGDEHHGD
jgi:acyl transferase domain-containing protein